MIESGTTRALYSKCQGFVLVSTLIAQPPIIYNPDSSLCLLRPFVLYWSFILFAYRSRVLYEIVIPLRTFLNMAIAKSSHLLTSKDLNIRPPSSANFATTAIVERPPQPLTLPTLHWQEICHDQYNGYCPRGADCPWPHTICHIQGMATSAEQAPRLSTKPNRLSLEPRLAHEGGPFDDDCAARRFWLTPNHNNDHSEIGYIRILPTTDEILCRKRPFMPSKDAQDGTSERRGKVRMLDVQFRHLRYDTLEPVIDACYHASQHLATTFQEPPPLDYEARQSTVRGTQYSLFRDVRLEDARFENHGMHLRLSFACPARLRQRRMLSSGHFEGGMLTALIGLDTENTLSTAFLNVEMCQSTLAMKPTTGNHLRASVVASFVEPSDTNTMRQTLSSLKAFPNRENFVIVEFPKVLVAGFYWILKHLQFLSSSNTEIAFSKLIAPFDAQRIEPIAAPAYSNSGSFPFDLSVLQGADKLDCPNPPQIDPEFMLLEPGKQQNIIENLCSATTLDHGQALALCENLSRGLAFTQGPPGTGKTFLGVSLAKVILRHAPQKPILVACMTNHALDNFLGDLVEHGITKIARIGSGSKEGWTDKYTMPSIRKGFEKGERSSGQKTKKDRAYSALRALWTQGTAWCDTLNTHTLTWAAVADHLKIRYPYAYSDFSRYETPSEQKASDVRRGRSEAGGYAFEHWSTGKDLIDTEEFYRDAGSFFNKSTTEILSADGSSDSDASSLDISDNPPHVPVAYPYDDLGQNVWSMPMDVRAAWITRWKLELGSSNPVEKLVEVQRRYLEAKRLKQELLDESDVKGLASQEVIGLTTTACAKYWPMLKSLDFETLICEEAGEVSEAQTITTLLPSIKHAIFIGDPLQLRPQVNQPSLSLGTTYGTKYRLDESLFERMVMPGVSGGQQLPASKLDLQRRMHPDVAQLLRATLYPYLKDHPSTSHLPVAGMAHRTFWLDHQEPEDAPNPLVPSMKSYSNAFECAMICELVRYLLNTNDFGSGEIAILVPYSQQLACLKEKLTATRACTIALSEKDKEDLIDMGLLDESEQSQFRTDVEVSPMVRLATIDGFQGEEAKVIILSTVRSNLQDRVGFLQTTNRINVACSRARNGFYIVGNSTLLRTVDILINSKKSWLAMNHATTCSAVDMAVPRLAMNQCFMTEWFARSLATNDMTSVVINATNCVANPVDTRYNVLALRRTSPLSATISAILFTNVVIDAAASAPSARRTTFTANVKGYVLNSTLAGIIAQPSVTLRAVLVRRAIYLAYDLVSMVDAEDLAESHATHVCSRARRVPVRIKSVPRFARYRATDCHAACPARTSYHVRTSALDFATRKLPAEAKIFLSCGHNFNVADLDAQLGLGKIFDISTSGEILAVKSRMAEVCKKPPECPQCHAPCGSVTRYRHFGQFQLAPETLERLYTKFGRKMRTFARNVQYYRKNLQQGFEWFRDNFEPGPLTGKANSTMIKARMLFIVPVETAIVRYRDEILARVEEDMARTVRILGNSYAAPQVRLSFRARLDLLYLHCRLTVVQEAARIVRFLRDFESPRHTERMGKILKMHTIREIDENMAVADELVAYCRSNWLLRLEAEATLVQLCFDAVAESLGSAGDNLERHERAEDLIVGHPDTAGILRPCYQSLDPYTKGNDSTAELWTMKTREFWEKWGEYRMGSLVYCKNGHPYSRKAFQECPECGGRKVQRRQIEEREEFVKTLDRDMFLKAMATLA
ncbi:MAG: hypothetical protein Q9226_001086 [Calogaya cf. arnoldii]